MIEDPAPRAEQLRTWLEDAQIASICLVRPINAVVARITGQALTSGIARRWALVPTYRRHTAGVLDPILEAVEASVSSGLVVCALDRTDRIRSPLLWCGARPSSPLLLRSRP